jgi:hypothetical protein
MGKYADEWASRGRRREWDELFRTPFEFSRPRTIGVGRDMSPSTTDTSSSTLDTSSTSVGTSSSDIPLGFTDISGSPESFSPSKEEGRARSKGKGRAEDTPSTRNPPTEDIDTSTTRTVLCHSGGSLREGQIGEGHVEGTLSTRSKAKERRVNTRATTTASAGSINTSADSSVSTDSGAAIRARLIEEGYDEDTLSGDELKANNHRRPGTMWVSMRR